MVYDTISDNLVQIGLSIVDLATLSYDIVLKKHISRIRDFTVQYDALPNPAQTVTFTDITNTPNVVLGTIAVADALAHTLAPATTPDTCGRILRITTTPALDNGDNILYLKIMFDTQGE